MINSMSFDASGTVVTLWVTDFSRVFPSFRTLVKVIEEGVRLLRHEKR